MRKTVFGFTFLFLIVVCLFLGCNSGTDTPKVDKFSAIPLIKLPFKSRCDKFPRVQVLGNYTVPLSRKLSEDTSTYFGKIVKGDLTILIKNQKNSQSPVLFVVNLAGMTIDSLILFDRLCFIGTDSYYLPWIEITKDLTVIRTDTSYHSVIKHRDKPMTKNIYEVEISTDTTLTIDRFHISNTGKITLSKTDEQ
jgi:hypothetical protein